MKWFFNLDSSIITSLLFTFGCLFVTILLAIIYYSKDKNNTMRTKIYTTMILCVLFTLVTEIINTLLLAYDIENFAYRTVYSLHWISLIVLFAFYYIYCILYLKDDNCKTFKELYAGNFRTKAMTIFLTLSIIVYFFMPVSDITPTNIHYIAGIAEYYVLAVLIFIAAIIIVAAFITCRHCPTRRKVAIFLVLFTFGVMLILQFFFSDVCIYVLVYALLVFFLYFIIENPDIQLAKEIEVLKQDIERSNRAKTDFLSNMSHEIRTPMNAIIGFSDSLLSNPNFDEATAKNDIRSITTASNNLLDIINNILDISKIEYGRETLDNKDANISNIVRELETIINTRIGNNPIKFVTEIDEKIPCKIYCDSTKLHQVLLNILSNSVKYTEVGKIKLRITPEFLKSQEEVMLHFKISDTGYGIKKEDFNKLFEKFNRLDTAVTKEIEGTGLGLVITKRFVDLMGGKIWFESEFEVGTTFFVDIPFKVTDSTPIGITTEQTTTTNEKTYLDCSKYTALVVDDNKLNIKVASRILEKYNFKIDTSESGTDCIYKYKSGNHYDIIFLDHMMPEMDGIETLHIILKLDDYDKPPIIALTANAMTGMREMYLNEGFDYYLAKPINISELDRIVNDIFKDKIKNDENNNHSEKSETSIKEEIIPRKIPANMEIHNMTDDNSNIDNKKYDSKEKMVNNDNSSSENFETNVEENITEVNNDSATTNEEVEKVKTEEEINDNKSEAKDLVETHENKEEESFIAFPTINK